MADPTIYEPGYDFTATDKGALLNTELTNIATSISEVVGALAVFPPVWAWVVVALVYLGYEAFVQSGFDEYYRMTWDWRDSVDDTVNVLCGAGVLISALSWGYWTALTVFGIWAASLAFSVWRRV